MKERLAALVLAATDLQVSGAIRPEQEARWGAFRGALEQAHAEAVDPAPLPEPVAALLALGEKVDALAVGVQALTDAAGV